MAASLTQTLSPALLRALADTAVFERGQDYAAAGRVSRPEVSALSAVAEVQGSVSYTVRLWLKGRNLPAAVRLRLKGRFASTAWRWGWRSSGGVSCLKTARRMLNTVLTESATGESHQQLFERSAGRTSSATSYHITRLGRSLDFGFSVGARHSAQFNSEYFAQTVKLPFTV